MRNGVGDMGYRCGNEIEPQHTRRNASPEGCVGEPAQRAAECGLVGRGHGVRYLGFIGEIIRHAPMLSERWRRMGTDEFGGVWLYDVTERFGREWAEELFNKTGMSPAKQLESIIEDEMKKWQ